MCLCFTHLKNPQGTIYIAMPLSSYGCFLIPYIVPNSFMILRSFEQGCSNERNQDRKSCFCDLKNHAAVRVSAGHDIGVSFFDVQDARMSRVHGCTGATLGTSFFGQAKKVLYMDVLILRSHGPRYPLEGCAKEQ